MGKQRKRKSSPPGGRPPAFAPPVSAPTRMLGGEAEARAAEAHVLRAVAEALNRAVSLQEALDRSLEAVMELVDSQAGWIVLLAELGGTRLAAARNLPPALEADDRAAMRWHGCTCQFQLAAGKLTAAVNILECERLQLAQGDTRGLRYHACIPLRAGARALGNFNLAAPAGRVFTDDELRLLTAVGAQIGVAIERARLYEQVKAHHTEEQAMLLRLSQTLLGLTEPQAVIDLAARTVAEALKVDFVATALMDADGTSVSARASLGWPGEILPQLQHVPREATPALTHAIDTRLPVVIPDASLETRFPMPLPMAQMGIVSSLIAPMVVVGKAIGGVVVNSRTVRHWSADEVRLLSLIADVTAQALERARLFEALAAEKRRLELLYNLSQNLTTSLDPRQVAGRALDLTASALGVFRGEMLVLEPGSDRLHLFAVSGYDAESVEALDRRLNLHTGQGLAGQAALTRAPLIAPDVTCDEYWLSVPGVDDWVRSAAAVPLLAGDELVGVLNLLSDREGFFRAPDLPLLTAATVPIALALQKAHLFQTEREQRELAEALRDALGAGAALSATLNFDAVLDRLLEQVARVVPYDAANVLLLDTPLDRIRFARMRGYEQFGHQATRDIAGLSFDIATTANLRWMAETGKPLVIPDTAAYPDWVKVEASTHVRSWAGAPIVVEGQVIAFFSLDKIEPNFYRPEHGERLAAFAGQAALALQNARLFGRLRESEERFRALIENSSDAIALLGPDGTVLYASPSTPRILGYSSEELVSRNAFELIHPEDIERALAAFTELVRKSGGVTTGEFRARHANGAWRWLEAVGTNLLAEPSVQAAVVNYRDATERKQSEEEARLLHTIALAISEAEDLHAALGSTLRLICDATGWVLGEAWVPCPDGSCLEPSPAWHTTAPGLQPFREARTGFAFAPAVGLPGHVWTLKKPVWKRDAAANGDSLGASLAREAGLNAAMGIPILAGEQVVAVMVFFAFELRDEDDRLVNLVSAVATHLGAAIERKRAEAALRQRLSELTVLHAVATAGAETTDEDELLERATRIIGETLYPDDFGVLLLDKAAGVLRFHRSYRREVDAAITGHVIPLGTGVTGRVAATRQSWRIADVSLEPAYIDLGLPLRMRSELCVPLKIGERVIGVINAESARFDAFTEADERLLITVAGQMATAIDRLRVESAERQRADELEALAQVSSALRQAQTREAMLPLLIEKTMHAFHADAGVLLLVERETLVIAAARGPAEALLGQQFSPTDGPLWQALHTGEPIYIPDVRERRECGQGNAPAWHALVAGFRACACIPLKTAEATVGLLHLASRSKRVASEAEIRLLTSIAEMAGNALHRATLYEQTAQRLQRLASLRAIDLAISASLDLHLTLNVLLDQVTTQLGIHAAALLLLDPQTQTLEYVAGRGFQSDTIAHARVLLGEGNAGRAALEQRIVHVSNLPITRPSSLRTGRLTNVESFVAYYAVPLIVKNQIRGVLEIFHRTPLDPDPEWLDFLEALAVQAAIALDNASLYDNLQRSKAELELAYDTTLEGWSRALDLREKETERHTQRVTELTLRLARYAGIPDAELVHIRRGALLHDIGKMGIPDSILLKPSPLTDEEWAMMCRHPQYAYEMLSPIDFLRPALDIPYCHHEKWDGTGYPRRLKAEQIPLAARIFAVADVWDALCSDRPYRAAWPQEKVSVYIQEQAGKHFDPQVVDVFQKMGV